MHVNALNLMFDCFYIREAKFSKKITAKQQV